MRSPDILEHWKARRTITARDYLVGQRVRRVWDEAEMVGLGAIRLDRLAPDRDWGSARQMLSVVAAREALLRMKPILGEVDNALVLGVIGKGQSVEAMTRAWGLIGGRDNCCRRIRMALRVLALKRWATAEEVFEPVPMRA